MKKTLLTGVALGMIGGALLVVNSDKTRKLIEKVQDKIKKTFKKAKKKSDAKKKEAENDEESEN